MIYFPRSPTTIISKVFECCKSPCSFIISFSSKSKKSFSDFFIPFLDSETEEKFQLQVLAIVGAEEKKALNSVLKNWQDVSIEEEEEAEGF